ncbi:MAG: glycosyltransferase family 1 protein [Candidatus Peregrinibacteria bacterium]
MKIGIDARMVGVHFTGIGRYTHELIHHLAELPSPHQYVVFLRKDNFDSFSLPSSQFSKVLADFPHYSWGEQTGFLRVLNQANLDLMHFTHFNAPLLYRRPFIVTIHDLTLHFFPGKRMNTLLHRLAYHAVIRSVTRRAKKIIAVSEHTKKDLMNVLGLPSEKIEVIYHGISPQFSGAAITPRTELMQKLGLQRPYFLYTGVWREHKNVAGMIRAFAAFNGETGHQYDLVITGKFNPSYPEIPRTIEELELKDYIKLTGIVAEGDLAALYRHALAYVFPSFYEGFGFPPLEAMAVGTPVITSNAAAIPEICGEGNALYFDPKNIEDMKQKMQLLATDASVRQRLINRGFERVKQFEWSTTAKKTLELYGKII